MGTGTVTVGPGVRSEFEKVVFVSNCGYRIVRILEMLEF